MLRMKNTTLECKLTQNSTTSKIYDILVSRLLDGRYIWRKKYKNQRKLNILGGRKDIFYWI